MKKIIISLLLIILSNSSFAQNLSNFATLPILHEGRVKPLESFARVQLQQLAGAENWQNQTATTWLANSVFKPETMLQKKFFKITNPHIKSTLNLSKDKAYTNFATLHAYFQHNQSFLKLLDKPTNSLSADEQDWLTLYTHYLNYGSLLSSLTLVLPLPFDPSQTYLTAHKKYASNMAQLVKQHGTNLQRYNFAQKQLAASAWQLKAMREAGLTSAAFKVIPTADKNFAPWLSPWGWQLENPNNSKALQTWQQAAFAYRNQDDASFVKATQKLLPQSTWVLQLETYYQRYKPIIIAQFFYGLGLLILLFTTLFKRAKLIKRHYAVIAISLGLACHTTALLCRIAILQRPPSGTLYETLLFVSFVTVLLGLLYKRHSTRTPTFMAAGLASILLFMAPLFKPQGDNLEMLQAVLNTNFWLTIHVLMITCGYAVSVLAAGLAHVSLFKRSTTKFNDVYKLLILALFLTAFGTMLGGIWADQSWGRFWGWDPKENGALLLALWLAWLLHGRVSGHLQPRALLALAAATNIIVALSWFGVNLLNIGLHSYGFTQGVAGGLAVFCAGEIALITWLYRCNK